MQNGTPWKGYHLRYLGRENCQGVLPYIKWRDVPPTRVCFFEKPSPTHIKLAPNLVPDWVSFRRERIHIPGLWDDFSSKSNPWVDVYFRHHSPAHYFTDKTSFIAWKTLHTTTPRLHTGFPSMGDWRIPIIGSVSIVSECFTYRTT